MSSRVFLLSTLTIALVDPPAKLLVLYSDDTANHFILRRTHPSLQASSLSRKLGTEFSGRTPWDSGDHSTICEVVACDGDDVEWKPMFLEFVVLVGSEPEAR